MIYNFWLQKVKNVYFSFIISSTRSRLKRSLIIKFGSKRSYLRNQDDHDPDQKNIDHRKIKNLHGIKKIWSIIGNPMILIICRPLSSTESNNWIHLTVPDKLYASDSDGALLNWFQVRKCDANAPVCSVSPTNEAYRLINSEKYFSIITQGSVINNKMYYVSL